MTNDNRYLHHQSRGEDGGLKKNNLKLRNLLNLIFMIGALAGVLLYFFSDQTTGTIVILAAMIFKIIETGLRFLR